MAKKVYQVDIDAQWFVEQALVMKRYNSSIQDNAAKALFLENYDIENHVLLFAELKRSIVGIPSIGADEAGDR